MRNTALIVLAVSTNTTNALVISQIVLSFGIPFALIPLMIFTSRRSLMGELVNRRPVNVAMAIVVSIITALNLYLLVSAVGGF